MAWSRKVNAFIVALVTLVFLAGSSDLLSQGNPVWSDDQWKQAKDGMGYEKAPAEKQEEEKNEEPEEFQNEEFQTEEDYEDSNWSFRSIFSSSTSKFIGVILLLIILIVIVYFIMQGAGSNKDMKVPIALESMPEVLNDLPEETNMERFLRLSLEAGDYKTSVRILYIMIIQRMHENSWIVWKKDKTNRDYLNEVRSRKSYVQFRDITLVYEIVWYGDNEITSTEFDRLRPVFDQLRKAVNDAANAQ